MSEKHTLAFQLAPQDQTRLGELVGQLNAHLRLIEEQLHVQIGNRGHLFQVEGDEGRCAQARFVMPARPLPEKSPRATRARTSASKRGAAPSAGAVPTSAVTCAASLSTLSISASARPVPARPISPSPPPFPISPKTKCANWCWCARRWKRANASASFPAT